MKKKTGSFINEKPPKLNKKKKKKINRFLFYRGWKTSKT